MKHRRSTSIALLAAALLLAVPAFGADCNLYDDGTPRPASDPNPDVACGGPGPTTPPEAPQGVGSLTTLFASNNGFAGNMFDIVPAVTLTITSFDVNLNSGNVGALITVYWRDGSIVGHESDPTGWNTLGTDTVNSNGTDVPTPVAIGGVTLQAGQTYGFYVSASNYPTGRIVYTNGGPTVFSNADMSLTTYNGKGNPDFTGSTFAGRQWNGTVYYDIVNFEYPLIQEIPTLSKAGIVALLALLAGAAVILLRRR